MGLFSNFFSPPEPEQRDATSSLENPSTDLVSALIGMTDGIGDSGTGVGVTPVKAMRVVAFFRCVSILAQTVASTEMLLYSRDGRSRTLVSDDARYDLISFDPNEDLTAFQLWAFCVLSMAVFGAGYIWMETDDKGKIIALWNIHPTKIEASRNPDGGKIWLVEFEPNKKSVLYRDEVMCFTLGVGLDANQALAPYAQLRDELGIGLAATDYAGRVYQNGSAPTGVFTQETNMTDQQFKTFVARRRAAHEGLKNSHKYEILPKGMTYTETNPNTGVADSALIDSRINQAKMVAMALGIPPRKLGINDGTSSYASAEQDEISFVTQVLRPIFVSMQQTIRKGMFSDPESRTRGLFVQHDTTPLTIPDSVSRSKIEQVDVMLGIRDVNEIREERGLPPVPGGDMRWMLLNHTPLDDKGMPIFTPRGSTAQPVDPLSDDQAPGPVPGDQPIS